jgi:hypothetical protein
MSDARPTVDASVGRYTPAGTLSVAGTTHLPMPSPSAPTAASISAWAPLLPMVRRELIACMIVSSLSRILDWSLDWSMEEHAGSNIEQTAHLSRESLAQKT